MLLQHLRRSVSSFVRTRIEFLYDPPPSLVRFFGADRNSSQNLSVPNNMWARAQREELRSEACISTIHYRSQLLALPPLSYRIANESARRGKRARLPVGGRATPLSSI